VVLPVDDVIQGIRVRFASVQTTTTNDLGTSSLLSTNIFYDKVLLASSLTPLLFLAFSQPLRTAAEEGRSAHENKKREKGSR
jgi:hypothetical protein